MDQCYSLFDQYKQQLEKLADKQTALSLQARALYGAALCKYQLVYHNDPHLRNATTIEAMLAAAASVCKTMQIVVPHDGLYWLVLNGTIYVYDICSILYVAGFGHDVCSSR